MADVVLGTGGMINFVRHTEARKIIVGTEMGMLYRLRQERPDIEYYLLSPGLICPNMKYTSPRGGGGPGEDGTPDHGSRGDQTKAVRALQRMLEASA